MSAAPEFVSRLNTWVLTTLVLVILAAFTALFAMSNSQTNEIKSDIRSLRTEVTSAIIASSKVNGMEQDIRDLRLELLTHNHE